MQAAALQHLSGLFGSGDGAMVLEYGTHFALKVGGGIRSKIKSGGSVGRPKSSGPLVAAAAR